MKPQLFLQVLTAGMITLGSIATIIPPSLAESKTYFCEKENDVWTTFAKNYNNQKIPVIRWVKTLGEYTPAARCQEVSSRFQSAYDKKGILNYLTSEISGGQAVICAASQLGGRCSQLLFTLKSPQDASSVLQHLAEIGYKARGPINQEDGSPQVYIDMNLLLKDKVQRQN